MKIVNMSSTDQYVDALRITLDSGSTSADMDPYGIRRALGRLVRDCSGLGVILNDKESELLTKLSELDARGKSYVPVAHEDPKEASLRKAIAEAGREFSEKVREFTDARVREEAINAETTYASRRDIDAAKARASSVKGDVAAKKLASTGAAQVSLHDLMGDNRFIEDSLKGSGIKTVLASDEGWDAGKVAEANAKTPDKTQASPEEKEKVQSVSSSSEKKAVALPKTSSKSTSPSKAKVRRS